VFRTITSVFTTGIYEDADIDAFKPGIYLLPSKKKVSALHLGGACHHGGHALRQQALTTQEWGPQTFQTPLTQQLMTQVIEDLLTTGILEECSICSSFQAFLVTK
jgi:hypothetical protein